MKYQATFDKEYQRLNTEQRQAVDATEGPVMVVAGPGTGKTQILALRICNILKQTDTQAHNILCLTFTEQGALEMKHRLTQFMGADAYKVHIHTYHSFARKVISENPDHFTNSRLEPISDLEAVEVVKEIIDGFKYGDRLFSINEGSRYDAIPNLRGLYNTMKQENLDPEILLDRIDEHLLWTFENIKKMTYSSKAKLGEPNERERGNFSRPFKRSKEAISTFQLYKDKLKSRNRFDFQDMINWTIDAMSKDADILLDYQEQYHYILADEFQDSNGSQMEILSLLVKDVDQPNLFVVGDDDQSIYRFQGANLRNLIDFKDIFDPQVIVLLKNYRSSAVIVEAAKSLISENKERLTNTYHFDKNFIADGPHKEFAIKPNLIELENVIAEETYLYEYIKKAKDEGKPLNEIGVIFKKHAVAEELIKVLTKNNIPVNVKRKVDVLKVPYIRNILNVLDLISKLSGNDHRVDHLIPDLLNLPDFAVPFSEIYKVSTYIKKENAKVREQEAQGKSEDLIYLKWMDLMIDTETMESLLGSESNIIKAGAKLQEWIKLVGTHTIQVIFQQVIEESGFLNEALTANDNYWKLELLNTVFDFIKDESAKNPDFNIKTLVRTVQLMEENNISLPYLDIISDAGGVQFVTAHGSKGMQFDTVFMLGTSQKNWKPYTNTKSIKLPPHQDPDDEDDSKARKESQKIEDGEEMRRLYYVAMTRARKELYITYGIQDTETSSKSTAHAEYTQNLMDNAGLTLQKVTLDAEVISSYQAIRMRRPTLKKLHWIDKGLLNDRLKDYVMNITHVNKYIKCPITFYFEAMVHVPSARTDSMGYGNAVHQALEYYIKEQYQAGPEPLGVDKLISLYKDGLRKFSSHFNDEELQNRIKHGSDMLQKYHNTYKAEWYKPKEMHFEKSIKNVVINGVPMQGNIDRIDVHDDGITVVDYKTGKRKTEKVKPPNEEKGYVGDQWRQVIAYSLLIEASPEFKQDLKEGILDFTESADHEKLKRENIIPSQEDKDQVAEEIKTVYDAINSHDFGNGCGNPKCRWCTFVEAHY